jgi:CheY-like chemotaxis protein
VGLRDGMTQMLKNKDSSFDFVCASDYESALETLKENLGIKIVILDLNLDGRSGLELIPELKKLSPDIAILIYTMFNDVIHAVSSPSGLKSEAGGFGFGKVLQVPSSHPGLCYKRCFRLSANHQTTVAAVLSCWHRENMYTACRTLPSPEMQA